MISGVFNYRVLLFEKYRKEFVILLYGFKFFFLVIK